ncbi:hypothetical protein FRC07_002587 [Ceratobasidium sp. 392]|nr:hypothetical protein FRC07_002587 [Ceratobasidium sp. 392]
MFLSGSIRVVKINDGHLASGISTSVILEHIANKCPNLSKLEFYCNLDEPTDGDGSEDTSLRTFASLSSFQRLRHLISTPIMIQSSALRLLAELPNLKDLWIKTESDTPPWDPSLCEQLPPGSFPVLESLSINLETCRDVRRFWEIVPLATLEKAYVSIKSTSDDDEGEGEFIPTLCQSSPKINSLRLTFSSQLDLDEEDREVHLISLDMFEHLARLPLKDFLSLGYAKLDFEDAWTRIARAWPSLTHIDFLHQPMRLAELALLTTNLPNLCRIECDLDMEHAVQAVGRNWQPGGEHASFPNLRLIIVKEFDLKEHACSYDYDLDDLARRDRFAARSAVDL